MKNRFPRVPRAAETLKSFATYFAVGLAAAVSGVFVISETAPSACASPDLDRRYALDSVGILRPYDNLDGLLADVVSGAFREWLTRREQSRFVYSDLSAADAILTKSKTPYLKLIEDRDILTQISRATRTESLVRTKVLREGPRYRVLLEWLHAPKMEVLATEAFTLDEPRGIPGEPADFTLLRADLQKGLARLFTKVPMMAQITGRDGDWVTLNLGRADAIERGDTVIIGTLEDAKRHPILNQVMDWRFVETGRAIVGDIEENLVFARVTEEQPGKKVGRWQKVVKVLPAADPSKPAGNPALGANERSASAGHSAAAPSQSVMIQENEDDPSLRARIGYITVGPVIGTLGREYTVPDQDKFRSGWSFVFGAAADGQLWLNERLFLDGGVTWTAPGGYSQRDGSGTETLSSSAASASLLAWKLGVGYLFRATRDFLGPRGFVKIGFGSDSLAVTSNESEYTGAALFSGLQLGLGGELPLRKDYGLKINADIGFMQSMNETGLTSGDPQGVTSVHFGMQGYGWWGPKLRIGGGVVVSNQSVTFDNERTLSGLGIAVGPNVSFFF